MLDQLTNDQFLNLMNDPLFLAIIVIISIWSLAWKGVALWKASRNYRKDWFVALLILNTVGILEILYIFVFSKYHNKGKEMESASTR